MDMYGHACKTPPTTVQKLQRKTISKTNDFPQPFLVQAHLPAMPPKGVTSEIVPIKALASQWADLLELRDPGFDWVGKSYSRPSRNQGADIEGLQQFAHGLLGLCRIAPAGRPGHASLRAAFQEFDRRHGVLGCEVKHRFRQASEASDIWRKMVRDLVGLKIRKVVFKDCPDLQLCLDALQVPPPVAGSPPSSSTATRRASPSPPAQTPATPAETPNFVSFSDSDVELVDILCNCPECVALRVPVYDLAESSSEQIVGCSAVADPPKPATMPAGPSDSAEPVAKAARLAECDVRIPSPALGGQQKQDTLQQQ